MSELLAFVAVSAIVIVTPGPDTALTLRNTMVSGRKGGLATALGVAGGQLFWALAAASGVAALLVASERVFTAVKLIGAAYLIVLGVQALLAAWRHGQDVDARGAPRGASPRLGLRQGFVSNLTNPKMAAFFTSLFPQFAAAGGGAFWHLLVLGVVFATMTLAWLSVYAFVAAALQKVLARDRVRRAIETITGVALIGLGVRVARDDLSKGLRPDPE